MVTRRVATQIMAPDSAPRALQLVLVKLDLAVRDCPSEQLWRVCSAPVALAPNEPTHPGVRPEEWAGCPTTALSAVQVAPASQ